MEWIAWALWAYVVAALHGLALWRAGRAARQAQPAADAPLPAYVLVRPVAGQEPDLDATLMSVAAAGAAPAQLLHLVARGDAAQNVAHRASAALSELGMAATTCITIPARRGDNPKVVQLLQADCATEFAIYADCSVDLSALRPAELLAPLQWDARLGAVWLPTYEAAATSLAQRANRAVRTASLHALLLLGQLDRQLLAGAVVVVRLAALQQVGGWAALRTQLGEDMALGQRLRRHGWRTAMLPYPLRVVRRDLGSWRCLLARYGRWLWVIRAQRPLLLLSYPLLFCASLPLAVLPWLWPGAPGWARLGGLALLAVRLFTAGYGRQTHANAAPAVAGGAAPATPRRRPLAWPATLAAAAVDSLLADLLLAAGLCHCLCSRHLRWGGQHLQVGQDGQLRVPADKRGRPAAKLTAKIGGSHPPRAGRPQLF